MSWTVEIGNQGAVLAEYDFQDFEFLDRLNGLGFGYALLPGIGSNPEPAEEDVIRFIWDKAGDNLVKFEGILLSSQRIDTGPTRKVTFLDVAGAALWRAQTGTHRHYEDKTPHQIIQGAITPSNLLTNAQGASTITFGTAAGVPDKIDGTNTGVQLDDFMADSRRLILNIQRLCLQSRYGTSSTPDGSYGLEFFGQLEGANNSSPRFYLVKRRAQSPAPGETFTVGDELVKARRGEKGLTAVEAMRVVGAGTGEGRVDSGAIVGSGGIEGIVQDKSIVGSTNATNMANRLQGLLDPTNEAVTASMYKHDFTSRVGDTVTLVQSGFGNQSLRIFELGYTHRTRMFTLQLGRPRQLEQDPFWEIEQQESGYGTAPQKHGNKLTAQPNDSDATLADNASIAGTESFTTPYNKLIHDGIGVAFRFLGDTGGDYDLRVQFTGPGPTTKDVIVERFQPQDTYTVIPGNTFSHQLCYFIDSSLLEAVIVGGLQEITAATVTVTNRTGGPVDAAFVTDITVSGA